MNGAHLTRQQRDARLLECMNTGAPLLASGDRTHARIHWGAGSLSNPTTDTLGNGKRRINNTKMSRSRRSQADGAPAWFTPEPRHTTPSQARPSASSSRNIRMAGHSAHALQACTRTSACEHTTDAGRKRHRARNKGSPPFLPSVPVYGPPSFLPSVPVLG
jgi:hypothetical protein